ncbi:hypothetical protein BGZ49_000088 [Haplosporangium sp. Z 27]|nr:hypothetical protein BGZ49_000088 [Haplosporangium sp. Z 27]
MTKLPEYMVPSGFVRMDRFPLTPNGKLDRRALPEPDSNAFITQEYEAPRDGIESTLATIWTDLLKVERVGRNDNFFMLGGHSLLAMSLVNEIHSKLGFNLTLHTIFEAPTISDLASIISDSVPYILSGEDQMSSFDVLFPLKSKGDRLPLFCIHSAVGLSWTYIGLSKHLHPEQPIYGLQSRGLNGKEKLSASIEEIASDYIKQIRCIQPHGPYHLLGWSFGGAVAHTMAVQLESLGEVALLGIMDSAAVFTNILFQSDIDTDIEKVILDKYRTLSVEDGKALWRSIQHVYSNNRSLLREFSASIFSGDILFFNATQSIIDPAGWAPFCLGKVEVHEIDCAHNDMDQPEPLAVIGRSLAIKLEESHSRFVNRRE